MIPFLKTARSIAIACAATVASASSFAQGFAAMASPPRFELRAKPGETTRRVIEISNAARSMGRYRVSTADWTFNPDASVQFHASLQPGSCRPWVAIERNQVQVPPGGRVRYRFEVSVPPDAPAGECRFALMIEGEDPAVARSAGFTIPVSGRLAIIVYVAVGETRPQLEIVESLTTTLNGERVPAIRVRNTGNAHGRISGFLSGSDAAGHDLEFSPATFPILPGETRLITLSPTAGRDEPVRLSFPVNVRGQLEWDRTRVDFDKRFV
jgi:hypothetical protein